HVPSARGETRYRASRRQRDDPSSTAPANTIRGRRDLVVTTTCSGITARSSSKASGTQGELLVAARSASLGGFEAWSENRAMRSLIDFDDLPQTENAHEFVGADYGEVPFSIILVHSAPGAGPRLHRHPYAE